MKIGLIESVNVDKTVNIRIAGILIPHVSTRFTLKSGQRVIIHQGHVIPVESYSDINSNMQIDIAINYVISDSPVPDDELPLLISQRKGISIYILTQIPISTFRQPSEGSLTEGGDLSLPNPIPYTVHQQDLDERYDPTTGIEYDPPPANIADLIAYPPRNSDFLDIYPIHDVIDDELIRDRDRDPDPPFQDRHLRAGHARKELAIYPIQRNIAYIRGFLSIESFHVLLQEVSELNIEIDLTRIRAVFQDKHTNYHGKFLRAKVVKPLSTVTAVSESDDLPWINAVRFKQGIRHRINLPGTHPSKYFTLVHVDPAFHENYIDFDTEQDFEDFLNGVHVLQPTALVERLYRSYIVINRLMNLQPYADQTFATPARFNTLLIGEKNIDTALLPISGDGPVAHDRKIYFRLNDVDAAVPEEPFYAREDDASPDSTRNVTYEPYAYAYKDVEELDIGTWIQEWTTHYYDFTAGDRFEGGPTTKTDPFTTDFYTWLPNTLMDYYYNNPACPLHEIQRGIPLSVWLYVTDWTQIRHSSIHLAYQYFMVPAFSKDKSPSTGSNKYFYPEADTKGISNFFSIAGEEVPTFLPNKVSALSVTDQSSVSFDLDNYRNLANRNSDGSTDPYFERGKLFFVTNIDTTITVGGLAFYPDPGVYEIPEQHPLYVKGRLASPASRIHSEVYARVWVSVSGDQQESFSFDLEYLPYEPYQTISIPQKLHYLSITDVFFSATHSLFFYKCCLKNQTCDHNHRAWAADPLPVPSDPIGSDPGNPIVICPGEITSVPAGALKLWTALAGGPGLTEVLAPHMACHLLYISGDSTGSSYQISYDNTFASFYTSQFPLIVDENGENLAFYIRYVKGVNEHTFFWTTGSPGDSTLGANPRGVSGYNAGVLPRGKARPLKAYNYSGPSNKALYGTGTGPYEFPAGSGEYWDKGDGIHIKIVGILGIDGLGGDWEAPENVFLIPAIRDPINRPFHPNLHTWGSPANYIFTCTPIAVHPPVVAGLRYNMIVYDVSAGFNGASIETYFTKAGGDSFTVTINASQFFTPQGSWIPGNSFIMATVMLVEGTATNENDSRILARMIVKQYHPS